MSALINSKCITFLQNGCLAEFRRSNAVGWHLTSRHNWLQLFISTLHTPTANTRCIHSTIFLANYITFYAPIDRKQVTSETFFRANHHLFWANWFLLLVLFLIIPPYGRVWEPWEGYIGYCVFFVCLFVRSSLSLIHIWRCRRIERCRSRWSPYH